jgi:hypothetical protein
MTAWKYLAIAACTFTTLASAETPPRAIQDTINKFVGALNGTKPEVFAGLFAQQASITDTLGAFNWQGEEVPTRYFAALQAELKADGWSNLQLAPNGNDDIMTKGAHAYAAVPLLINYVLNGTQKQDHGIFTLTLTDYDGGWKITSATWTYGTLNPPSN